MGKHMEKQRVALHTCMSVMCHGKLTQRPKTGGLGDFLVAMAAELAAFQRGVTRAIPG